MSKTVPPTTPTRPRRSRRRIGVAVVGLVLVVAVGVLGGVGWVGSERAIHQPTKSYPWQQSDFPNLRGEAVSRKNSGSSPAQATA